MPPAAACKLHAEAAAAVLSWTRHASCAASPRGVTVQNGSTASAKNLTSRNVPSGLKWMMSGLSAAMLSTLPGPSPLIQEDSGFGIRPRWPNLPSLFLDSLCPNHLRSRVILDPPPQVAKSGGPLTGFADSGEGGGVSHSTHEKKGPHPARVGVQYSGHIWGRGSQLTAS